MKKTIFLIAFMIAVSFLQQAIGQNFEIPKGYDFKTAKDYSKYEAQIIEAVNWLESTPLDQETAKRKDVSAFFIKWLTGTPTVSVEVTSIVSKFSEKNPDFLILFMGGWARYKLQNSSETDKIKLNTEGVKAVIKSYKAGGAKKDKEVEKIAKLTSEEDLTNWVKSNVK